MDLSRIRDDLERFAEALSREEYLTRAGLKDESGAAAVRERFASLGSRPTFQEVQAAARETADADEGRRLRFLAEFLGTNCIEYQVREPSDRLTTAEAAQTIAANGERIPLRSAEVRIKNEADRSHRATLESARLAAVAELSGLRREILERSHQEAERLGFAGYTALCRELSGVDLVALRDLTQPILSRSLDMYRDLLAWYLRRQVGVKLAEAGRHDLVRLFRAPEFDASLPPAALREAAEAPLRRMGIDPQAGGRIRVDDEPRPKKTPRAFVATPRIPDEVILVVRPGGGPDDYAAFLHELGHALHFAYTDPHLAVEYRRLGDASVTEAFAFLMDGLLRERGWLRRFVGLTHPADFQRFAAFHTLWFLRRYAAKLAFELILHDTGPVARCAEVYRELLAGATLVDWPRELYLADVDPFFYAGRYLRAWIFEAQLRQHLRERFDEEWYRNDRTGPFLLALWQQGQRQTVEELAVELGLGPLSLEPLLAQITADLR
ncbi:MAG: hypothetical protein HYT85_11465 [candidate division NC10 bacterium]|nr:hypothetical protein [candidate division NC10 bacterium]MBI2563205.1 hypothetical protein [candidate division NC10 bacterium]